MEKYFFFKLTNATLLKDIWFPLQFLQPSKEMFFVLKRKVKITLMYQLDIIVCNFESFLSDRYIHS